MAWNPFHPGGPRPTSSWAALFLWTLSTLSLGCGAKLLTPLPIEEVQQPGPDEGFLLLETESNQQLERLEIERLDAFGRHETAALPNGRRLHLVSMPAGEYRWAKIQARVDLPPLPSGLRYRPGADIITWEPADEPDMRFRVEAGKVNYPGVLVLIGVPGNRMAIFTVNRSGEMVEDLGRSHPWLLSELPLVYTGRLRDDFLAAYQERFRSQAGVASPGEAP